MNFITEENQKIIDAVVDRNDYRYNLHKASEECQELGLVLTQLLLKPDKVDQQEVIDEIGDVIIRIEMLCQLFPLDKIMKRLDDKLAQFKNYHDSDKYPNI